VVRLNSTRTAPRRASRKPVPIQDLPQPTGPESLRDSDVCLPAQAPILHDLWIRAAVAHPTPADANGALGWRTYAEFAHALIAEVHKLNAGASFGGSRRILLMAWAPPPTICASRCISGRRFVRPKRRPSCTHRSRRAKRFAASSRDGGYRDFERLSLLHYDCAGTVFASSAATAPRGTRHGMGIRYGVPHSGESLAGITAHAPESDVDSIPGLQCGGRELGPPPQLRDPCFDRGSGPSDFIVANGSARGSLVTPEYDFGGPI